MKPLKALPLPPKKRNLLPSGLVKLFLPLALLLLMIGGGVGCAPAEVPLEVAEFASPFETFLDSRMALPETTPPTNPVAVDDDFIDGPVSPQRLFREEQADLDDDGQGETYSLRNGCLSVTDQGDHLLWQSPEEWWIDDFFLGDITNDGRQNLCLSVWREGSYGPYRPFWEDDNDSLVRNHLFLYQMEEAGEHPLEKPSLKAVWQSSHLARPNYRAFIAQIDGEGENHLVVIQGDYENPEAAEIAFWKWNGWGFSPSQNYKIYKNE